MLSKGLRDEENKQMDKLFNDLSEMEFLPDYWELQQRADVDKKLQEVLGIDLKKIESVTTKELFDMLKDLHFSSENYEQLGDILFRVSAFEPEAEEIVLINHTGALYEYSQKQSGTFDFRLDRKLKEAREAL